MNSTHPFYTILIPSTSYVKKLIYRGPRGPKNLQRNLMISKNYFSQGLLKYIFDKKKKIQIIFVLGVISVQ